MDEIAVCLGLKVKSMLMKTWYIFLFWQPDFKTYYKYHGILFWIYEM